MRPRGHLPKPAIFSRRLLSIVVRRRGHRRCRLPARSDSSPRRQSRRPLRSAYVRDRRCGAVRRRLWRHRSLVLASANEERTARMRALEEAADRNWELKEAEERAKSFLEAQGDLIVRRDGDGRITYVNDAFCALAGRAARDAARHRRSRCRSLEQGDTRCCPTARASTTRRSPTADGARWIAWREVAVRAEQPSSRDAERRPRRHRPRRRPSARSPKRATRPRPPTAPSRASSRWCRTRSARR